MINKIYYKNFLAHSLKKKKMKKNNSKADVKAVLTFDLSTHYTKLPHFDL